MKKAVFPILSLVLIICCAVLVYQERNRTPVYVDLISETVVSETEEEESGESDFEIININTASLDELTSLTGIGEVIGQRIIDYRENSGAFRSKEEIMEVSGIGEKVFEGIKNRITV
ncbi:MAG: ComEA family DNA-binding protein [Oscillospiraceae bacterium]|nr:ComEA family DNA-binding protein [Oscillospiraceae bacterium]